MRQGDALLLQSTLLGGLPDYIWPVCKVALVISTRALKYTLLSSSNIRASLGWTRFNEWI